MGFALSSLRLSSPAFQHGAAIPAKYSYDNDNVSPPLQWRDLPEGTRSLAVFCHDPDAPKVSSTGNYGFVHWLLYNIPPETRTLETGERGYAKGANDFLELGYGGPRPPAGHGQHHYYFWLVALNLEPSIHDGLTLADFLEKVEPHVIGMNRLMGTYETPQ